MKIIDAHCHIHSPQWVKTIDDNDFLIKEFNVKSTEKEILLNMQEANIDKTIVFPMPSVEVNLEAANLYTLYISKLYPDKFVPFTVIDEKPEKWFNLGIKGFKEHTFGQRIQKDENGNDIFSQKFKKTYQFMEKYRIPLLLHAGANRIDRIKNDILKDTPNLIIIMAHLGADFPISNGHRSVKKQIVMTLKKLKDFSNLYWDITAIIDNTIINEAIKILGIDKLIFGSDFPYETPSQALERLNKLNLTNEDKEKLLYENIKKIIGNIK